jgi:hypothetical protein
MYCYVHDSKVNLGTRCSLKMNKNMNKRATENSILKFLTVSSVSSDSIVKGIIGDIVNTARQKCIVMYTTVQVCSEFGKFAYTAICMRNVYTMI